MICEESEHDWKIAWENAYYSISEVTCSKCGLVFWFNTPRGNGHNGLMISENSPGYRARNWRKSLRRSREHPEWIKRNQNESRIPVVI